MENSFSATLIAGKSCAIIEYLNGKKWYLCEMTTAGTDISYA